MEILSEIYMVALCLALGLADQPENRIHRVGGGQTRIGIYDSRAVAVAYCGTPRQCLRQGVDRRYVCQIVVPPRSMLGLWHR